MIYDQAIQSAKDLLSSLNLTQAPVDVREITASLGIVISEVPNEDDKMSGLILRGKEKTLIGLNLSHSENRKRFTIAHELGHYRLHSSKDVFVDSEENFFLKYRIETNVYDPEESEANAFAAELLMPEEWIRRTFEAIHSNLKIHLGDLGNSEIDSIISALARKFAVSDAAMRIRLENLFLI